MRLVLLHDFYWEKLCQAFEMDLSGLFSFSDSNSCQSYCEYLTEDQVVNYKVLVMKS